MPPPRDSHTALMNNGAMYVFGGFNEFEDGNEIIYNDLWRFDMKSGTWSNVIGMGSVPAQREGHSMKPALGGKALCVIGGRVTRRLEVFLFYFETAKWDRVSLANSRNMSSITGEGSTRGTTNSAEFSSYNSTVGSSGSGVEEAEGVGVFSTRYYHSCVEFGGRFYVFGGCRGSHGDVSNDTLVIDIDNDLCAAVNHTGAVPEARFCHSAVCYNGRMLVFGGTQNGPDINMNDVHEFNIGTSVWSIVRTTGAVPRGRFAHSCHVDSEGLMCIVGGTLYSEEEEEEEEGEGDEEGEESSSSSDDFASLLQVYNVNTRVWKDITCHDGPMPHAASGMSCVFHEPDAKLLLFGGVTEEDGRLNDMCTMHFSDADRSYLLTRPIPIPPSSSHSHTTTQGSVSSVTSPQMSDFSATSFVSEDTTSGKRPQASTQPSASTSKPPASPPRTNHIELPPRAPSNASFGHTPTGLATSSPTGFSKSTTSSTGSTPSGSPGRLLRRTAGVVGDGGGMEELKGMMMDLATDIHKRFRDLERRIDEVNARVDNVREEVIACRQATTSNGRALTQALNTQGQILDDIVDAMQPAGDHTVST